MSLPERRIPATSAERIFLMGAVVAVLGAHLDLEEHDLTISGGEHPRVRVRHYEHDVAMVFRVTYEPDELMVIGRKAAWKMIEKDIERALASYIEQIQQRSKGVDSEREPGQEGADEGP